MGIPHHGPILCCHTSQVAKTFLGMQKIHMMPLNHQQENPIIWPTPELFPTWASVCTQTEGGGGKKCLSFDSQCCQVVGCFFTLVGIPGAITCDAGRNTMGGRSFPFARETGDKAVSMKLFKDLLFQRERERARAHTHTTTTWESCADRVLQSPDCL